MWATILMKSSRSSAGDFAIRGSSSIPTPAASLRTTCSTATMIDSEEGAHHLIEEAGLFIEAAHACHGRITEQSAESPAPEVGRPSA